MKVMRKNDKRNEKDREEKGSGHPIGLTQTKLIIPRLPRREKERGKKRRCEDIIREKKRKDDYMIIPFALLINLAARLTVSPIPT